MHTTHRNSNSLSCLYASQKLWRVPAIHDWKRRIAITMFANESNPLRIIVIGSGVVVTEITIQSIWDSWSDEKDLFANNIKES
jgi:hypothetical protein